MKSNRTLIVWDLNHIPTNNFKDSDIVYWNKKDFCNQNSTSVSIMNLIEIKPLVYREKYLSWISKISNQIINGKLLSEKFIIKDDFSFWWLTSLMQKCNIQNNSLINDAIKSLALEDYFYSKNYSSIEVFSNNLFLIESIGFFCKKNNITYLQTKNELLYRFSNEYFFIIFNIFKSLGFLFIYFLKNFLNFKKINRKGYDVTFVDIFVHFKKESYISKTFESNYWTLLTSKLKNWNIGTNWIHIFTPSPSIGKIGQAEELNNYFNLNSNSSQYHYLLNSRISFRQFFEIIFNYIKLIFVSIRHIKYCNILPDRSNFNLWYLHKIDFLKSVSGPVAMESILRYELFDNYFKEINYQRLGFYIMENQPWEFVLNYIWKKNNHGKLIGVAHSTVRFWDLRYFFDVSVYVNFERNLFLPSLIAVNGDFAYNNLTESGVPNKLIIKLEALRYLYSHKVNYINKFSDINIFTVLICGDFSKDTNLEMFRIVLESNLKLNINIRYIFKPHPAFGFDKLNLDLSSLNLVISEDQIFDIFPVVDLVICSAMSSVSVDAYIYNKHLIQIDSGKTLNFSPLYRVPGIKSVSSSHELYFELNNFNRFNEKVSPLPYFLINNELLNWKNCLLNFSKHSYE